MRKIMLVLAAMCAALLTGCGHNSIQYGDGVGHLCQKAHGIQVL